MKITALLLSFLFVTSAFARDVYVKGYTRKNGTYVAPHVRSSPDSHKWNNYGRATSSSVGTYDRDQDNDGILNQYDTDDNNNGVHDDAE